MITTNIDPVTQNQNKPDAYRIESITLTNHAGTIADITRLVTSCDIQESIYNLGLQFELSIIDSVNAMERLALSGQEKITITFTHNKNKHKLHCITTEYPLWERRDNNLVGVYKVKGTSPHVFAGEFKRLSSTLEGTPPDLIKNILTNHLSVPEDKIICSASSNTGIIRYTPPSIKPIKTIKTLADLAQDIHGSPIFVYTTLDGNVHIDSLRSMYQGESHNTYQSSSLDTSSPTRIRSLSGDLGLSKYYDGSAGAYASHTTIVSPLDQTIRTENFNSITAPIQNIDGEKLCNTSETFTVDAQPLHELHQARHFVKHVDPFAYSDEYTPLALEDATSCNMKNSYHQNMNNITLSLDLNGDTQLSPGRIITLSLPQTIPPVDQGDGTAIQSRHADDQVISGRYLITSSIHSLTKNYVTSVRIKRDAACLSGES